MLSTTQLNSLKPKDKPYKVADRDGMYVTVSPAGTITFRYDYRLNGRRETLTLGRYGPDAMSLAEAREALTVARKKVHDGISPAREKADGKTTVKQAGTFEEFAKAWLGNAGLADSTKAMRKSILDRDVLPRFGKYKLEEIKPSQIMALCDKIKTERDAPATALHVREIIQQVYKYAIGRGLDIENPASKVSPSAIAVFKPRNRELSPEDIRVFFQGLDRVASMPHLKLAVKFLLLTMVRKGELINATWDEVNFDTATWTIPAERMKMTRAHNVYLSQQALDILVALKTCAGCSPYVLPSRYDSDKPISDATLNRLITAGVEQAREAGNELHDFGPHDFRHTASTLLHEAGYNSDWIEKSLAHEQKGVRAIYNKAEYAEQRRAMLQDWANMVDGWIKGADIVPIKSNTAA